MFFTGVAGSPAGAKTRTRGARSGRLVDILRGCRGVACRGPAVGDGLKGLASLVRTFVRLGGFRVLFGFRGEEDRVLCVAHWGESYQYFLASVFRVMDWVGEAVCFLGVVVWVVGGGAGFEVVGLDCRGGLVCVAFGLQATVVRVSRPVGVVSVGVVYWEKECKRVRDLTDFFGVRVW